MVSGKLNYFGYLDDWLNKDNTSNKVTMCYRISLLAFFTVF